EQVSAV
nr:Chain B, Rap guanine nucleotide exchange factor 6 [Homo sapiens]